MKPGLIKSCIFIISVIFFTGCFTSCDKKPKNMPKIQKSGKVRPSKKAITQGSSQKLSLPSEKDSSAQKDTDTATLTPTPEPTPEPTAKTRAVKPKRKLQKKSEHSGP